MTAPLLRLFEINDFDGAPAFVGRLNDMAVIVRRDDKAAPPKGYIAVWNVELRPITAKPPRIVRRERKKARRARMAKTNGAHPIPPQKERCFDDAISF